MMAAFRVDQARSSWRINALGAVCAKGETRHAFKTNVISAWTVSPRRSWGPGRIQTGDFHAIDDSLQSCYLLFFLAVSPNPLTQRTHPPQGPASQSDSMSKGDMTKTR